MSVQFTKDVEASRPRRNVMWEYYSTDDFEDAIIKARELGWKENKIQLKGYKNGPDMFYQIEPYEEDCGCPNLIAYFD